jgi:hypothetical protein
MSPEFPLRMIWNDGEVTEIASPDELLAQIDTIDTDAERGRVWIRDALDRTVRLRMRAGFVEILET